MPTTTKKDETPSMLDDLKAQASALADKIKAATDAHLETLHAKLKDAHEVVQSLTSEIQKHSGKSTASAKRPYTRKVKATAKASKKTQGKRGAVAEAIFAYLATKGAKGAHVNDIAAAVGNKPANITAFFYAGAGKKKGKKVAPNTFALKK